MAVNLIKGQKVSLKKENGIALSRVMVGLGWDPVKKGGKGIFGSLFGGGFLVFQFRSQTKAFFVFRLRRIVILHTECAGVDPKREKRNDKGAKTYDVPKHLFSCIFDVQQ